MCVWEGKKNTKKNERCFCKESVMISFELPGPKRHSTHRQNHLENRKRDGTLGHALNAGIPIKSKMRLWPIYGILAILLALHEVMAACSAVSR